MFELPEGIAPATPAMVEDLAARIRPEHEREANALMPMGGVNALRHNFAIAAHCFAGIREGEVLFLFGIGKTSPLTRACVGWMMGADAIDRHGVWLAARSREMIPALHRLGDADRIENWIPCDYAAALRWLEWLGFDIGMPEPVINGIPHVHVFHDGKTS